MPCRSTCTWVSTYVYVERDALHHADYSCVVVQQSRRAYPNITRILHGPPSIGNSCDLSKCWASQPVAAVHQNRPAQYISIMSEKKWSPFSCCSSIAQYPWVPKLWSIVSQDHSLACCSFSVLLPIPEKSLLHPVIPSRNFSIFIRTSMQLHFQWYGLGRLLALHVSCKRCPRSLYTLSLLITPSCKCLKLINGHSY